MPIRMVALIVTLCSVTAYGSTDDDRAKLMGTWQIQSPAGKDTGTGWILQQRGDAIHITELENDRKRSEFDCKPTGQDCTTQDVGHPAKVSLWFNGSKLVELETVGSSTVKRRFSVTGQGDKMEVEVISIVPDRKPERLEFRRVPAANSTEASKLPEAGHTP